jgi:hypothetical protein
MKNLIICNQIPEWKSLKGVTPIKWDDIPNQRMIFPEHIYSGDLLKARDNADYTEFQPIQIDSHEEMTTSLKEMIKEFREDNAHTPHPTYIIYEAITIFHDINDMDFQPLRQELIDTYPIWAEIHEI